MRCIGLNVYGISTSVFRCRSDFYGGPKSLVVILGNLRDHLYGVFRTSPPLSALYAWRYHASLACASFDVTSSGDKGRPLPLRMISIERSPSLNIRSNVEEYATKGGNSC